MLEIIIKMAIYLYMIHMLFAKSDQMNSSEEVITGRQKAVGYMIWKL